MNKVGNIIQIAQPLSIILSNLFREPLLRLGERDCVCARVIKIESSPVCERKSEGSRSRSAREARCENDGTGTEQQQRPIIQVEQA